MGPYDSNAFTNRNTYSNMPDVRELEQVEYMDIAELTWVMHQYYSGYPISLTTIFGNRPKCAKITISI